MASQKPHIVIIPTPYQGHINPMMKLASILHSRGFYITLVLTEFNFATISSTMGSKFGSLQNLHGFRIETISDGLPLEAKRGALEMAKLSRSLQGDETKKEIRGLLRRLIDSPDVPPISYIIIDVFLFSALEVGKELGISMLYFVSTSACAILGFMQYDELLKSGRFPLKDESYLTNGYLDTTIDWVPGLIKGAKMKHLPTFIRTTDRNDIMFNYLAEAMRKMVVANGVIFNTFADLEGQVLEAIKAKIPTTYVVGPLALLCQQELKGHEHEHLPLTLSLWKEDPNCLEWLNNRTQKSVIYVNFGSLTILTPDQFKEFAWGLANSNHPFLWVIRSNLVEGASDILSDTYLEEIKGRGLLTSWCPQEKVLKHPSIAAFFTHCGWNSTLESICEGLPLICWPYFGDQQTNCLYMCQEWRIGVEMEEGEVKRDKVEELVREMMGGEKGKELKRNALEWKRKADVATRYGGSSSNDFDELVKHLIGNL